MSLISAPIANFLSTYGTALNKIFNTNAKIPLVCAIDPTGVALGGAGTVGDTEFLTNFATAAGTSGQDAARAFDLSGPIPLMCMVNPDGTPYESYSAPYQEISFNWYQDGIRDPIVVAINSNTFAPAPAITTGYLAPGTFSFDFDEDIFPLDKSTVEVTISSPYAATGARNLYYQVQDANTMIVRAYDLAGALADTIGYQPGGTYSTLNIKIYQ